MVIRRLKKLLLVNRVRQNKPVRKLFLFETKPQKETPVEKIEIWSASLEFHKR